MISLLQGLSAGRPFEAENGDFRYQLTAIGAPCPGLYIARRIAGNAFSIAGGAPGVEVSWQVTGVRRDPYARAHPLVVELGTRASGPPNSMAPASPAQRSSIAERRRSPAPRARLSVTVRSRRAARPRCRVEVLVLGSLL